MLKIKIINQFDKLKTKEYDKDQNNGLERTQYLIFKRKKGHLVNIYLINNVEDVVFFSWKSV